MPLTRANVTAAARRMLPTYPLFFGVVGLGLGFTDKSRLLETPAFAYADQLVEIRWWAVGFLTLSAVFVVALLQHERKPYQVTLGVAIVWTTLWAVVTLLSAFFGDSSFTAWVWPAFVARACWASLISLESRES